MKKGYIAVGVLFAIDVAVTAAFVAIMPDQVPVHFTGGEIDRSGSRFESFTVPALALAFGLFMMLLTRFGDEGNRATMMKLNVGMQAIFIAVTVFASLSILSHDVSDISLGAPDAGMSKITAFVIGATLLFLGYLMPKATRNSAFGVRLPWTQKNDAAWQEGQRFGARTSIAAGILMIVCGILFDGDLAFAATMVVFAAWALISIIGSYFACKDIDARAVGESPPFVRVRLGRG